MSDAVLLKKAGWIRVGFGWELYPRQYSGGFLGALTGGGGLRSADCDGSALFLGRDGGPLGESLEECCIFYGNTHLYDFAAVHNGDNLTGIGGGDDESLLLDLPRLPAEVAEVALIFDFFKSGRRMNFGKLQEVFVRITDDDTGEELCRFEPRDIDSSCQAILAARLLRRPEGWLFQPEGRPLSQAKVKEDLMGLRTEK